VKNGNEEIKDDAGNPTISIIWTECSRILSQGTNWGAFSCSSSNSAYSGDMVPVIPVI
jgi:hypothetical protein